MALRPIALNLVSAFTAAVIAVVRLVRVAQAVGESLVREHPLYTKLELESVSEVVDTFRIVGTEVSDAAYGFTDLLYANGRCACHRRAYCRWSISKIERCLLVKNDYQTAAIVRYHTVTLID